MARPEDYIPLVTHVAEVVFEEAKRCLERIGITRIEKGIRVLLGVDVEIRKITNYVITLRGKWYTYLKLSEEKSFSPTGGSYRKEYIRVVPEEIDYFTSKDGILMVMKSDSLPLKGAIYYDP